MSAPQKLETDDDDGGTSATDDQEKPAAPDEHLEALRRTRAGYRSVY